jgi:23S rRNA (pseudouridine1915-N3)-methyltransferase
MKLRVCWVKSGRGRSPEMEALAAEYAKRIQPFMRLELVEFKSEAALLEAQKKVHGRLVLLERSGKSHSSVELAELIRTEQEELAPPLLTFAIGPADGFNEAALRSAHRIVSFGPITLPHDLARVVLMEQLYRAFAILKGHPYHGGH